MNRESRISKSWLIAVCIVVLAALWMLTGIFGESSDDAGNGPGSSAHGGVPLVEVEESIAEPMTSRLRLTGRTESSQQIEVRAETSGIVAEIGAKRGAAVEKGDLLVRLAVEDRRARLLEARSQLADAESKHEAAIRLEQQGLQAQTARIQARAALDAARAAVTIAELELQRIEISAPIPGIVNEREVEAGDFVDRGEIVATIVDLDPIRVVGQVSERYLGQIGTGTRGVAETLDGQSYEGTVSYVGRIADDTTRTFPVELEIANPDGRIIDGITAELTLPVDQVFAHRIAPSALDIADDGTLGVKAVDSDGIVRFHEARILGDSQNGLWVGGLPDRLQLIVTGQAFVRPGQAVEVQRRNATRENQ